MEDHKVSLGRLLRSYRERAGLSQHALAEKSGISDRTIQRLESDQMVRPSRLLLLPIANELHLTNEEREPLFLAADQSKASVNTEQALQNAVERVAKANPKNIQEVAAAQTAIIIAYYYNGLEQSKKSFVWSLIWGGIGSGFLLGAITVLLFRQPTEIAYASGIGDVLVEMFAGTYLYLYKHASDQLATYRPALENMQKILLANSMCEGLDTEAKQSARIDLIRSVGTSATQLDIPSSNSQKLNKSAS
jgi:transcriptional regulator with XRE-family HTH domain